MAKAVDVYPRHVTHLLVPTCLGREALEPLRLRAPGALVRQLRGGLRPRKAGHAGDVEPFLGAFRGVFGYILGSFQGSKAFFLGAGGALLALKSLRA